jgi:2-polyprenyl-3-methyl-5-hydroxy-6-metoxy-1,4-benzoquinol methylase
MYNNIELKCPVCKSAKCRRLHSRDINDLYGCGSCGTNFLVPFAATDSIYCENYFKSGHIESYGMTYIEDEERIREFSRRRLSLIKKLKPNAGSLLDVGSALGVFSDEAKIYGFDAHGLDVSVYARGYAARRFGIRSWSCVEEIDCEFDVITMWFVLEHIEDPLVYLKKINNLLSEGGLLCLGLPNASGAFARFNKKDYYSARPKEHKLEPTPTAAGMLLRNAGFILKKTIFFGLHPKRFFFPEIEIIRKLQRILCLGDTFEMYAIKDKNV